MENIKTSVYMMLACSIISACMLYFALLISKKTKSKKLVCFFALLTTICVIICGYFSLDLVYKDYVTEIGIYHNSHRSYYYYTYIFDIGKDRKSSFKVSSEEQLNDVIPEKGELYEYVYAKRTRVLLDIEKIS